MLKNILAKIGSFFLTEAQKAHAEIDSVIGAFEGMIHKIESNIEGLLGHMKDNEEKIDVLMDENVVHQEKIDKAQVVVSRLQNLLK
jgi:phage-related minor tail protein